MSLWTKLGILGSAMGLRAALAADGPSIPTDPPKDLRTYSYYFAATATDNYGLESDYSNEVSLIKTNRPISVSLAWAPSLSIGIADYKVYWGPATATYTNRVSAGTNLSVTIQLSPIPKTNCIVRFSASCTNWASFTITNPGLALYVRAVPIEGPMEYTVHSEAANSLDGEWASFSGIWPDWTTSGIPQVKLYIQKTYE